MTINSDILKEMIISFTQDGNFRSTIPNTVVSVFSGPRDERPPKMYEQFSEVPIDFQRICPLDQRTSTERGRGQFFCYYYSTAKADSHTDFFFFSSK